MTLRSVKPLYFLTLFGLLLIAIGLVLWTASDSGFHDPIFVIFLAGSSVLFLLLAGPLVFSNRKLAMQLRQEHLRVWEATGWREVPWACVLQWGFERRGAWTKVLPLSSKAKLVLKVYDSNGKVKVMSVNIPRGRGREVESFLRVRMAA